MKGINLLYWLKYLRPRRRSTYIFFCFISGLLCFLTFFISPRKPKLVLKEIDDDGSDLDYFQFEKSIRKNHMLVDSPGKCQVPEINWWNKEVQRFLKHPSTTNCKIKLARVSDTQENLIIINKLLLGYRSDSISCCYRAIHRKEQSLAKVDQNADRKYTVSKICLPLKDVTISQWRFIKVECTKHGWFSYFDKVIYSNFHALPILPEDYWKDGVIQGKIKFWKKCLNTRETMYGDDARVCYSRLMEALPPSVLLLGIDSTSRVNFHRFMNKTISILNKLGAVEMNGYMKVGDNTYANFVPLMTSLSTTDLEKVCQFHSSDPFDDCPFLWKEYSTMNYLTGLFEDTPKGSMFNYEKTGFVKSPVDIYPRAFMLALYEAAGDGNLRWMIPCAGYERPEEVILQFTTDIMSAAASKLLPFFITTWLTDLTHEDMNSVQNLDNVMAQTLTKLWRQGLLDNTITFVISDHGYRFQNVRRTFSGWYEDKLPALWVHIPDYLKMKHPSWLPALESNSRLLTSAYDIYATLKHILNSSFVTPSSEAEEIIVEQQFLGRSLLTPIIPRNCEQAGIPEIYCACQLPKHFDGDETIIQAGAQAMVTYINAQLPPCCSQLSLSSIYTKGIIHSSENPKMNHVSPADKLIIGIKTSPGGSKFESRVGFNKHSNTFTNVTSVVRTNKLQPGMNCMNGNYILELLCYCKNVEENFTQ